MVMESLEWVRGDKLGEGVTGEVFTAHHPVHGLCAAKVLKVTETLLNPLLLVHQLVMQDFRRDSVQSIHKPQAGLSIESSHAVQVTIARRTTAHLAHQHNYTEK